MSVIVHTMQTSKDVVMRMVELGVAGYLLKPFDPDSAKAKLAAIFSKLATHNSQRRHIRIRPSPDELARVSFRIGRSTADHLGADRGYLAWRNGRRAVQPARGRYDHARNSGFPRMEIALAGKSPRARPQASSCTS